MSEEQNQTDLRKQLQLDADPKPFKSLLGDERDLQRVFATIHDVILRSFGVDIQREPFKPNPITDREVKRRFGICERWFRRARGDLGYSLERTMDMMGHALRCELDGNPFDPQSGGPMIWTPT